MDALQGPLASFLAFLPQLVFFLPILIIGFIVAKVLTKVGFDKQVVRGGLEADAAGTAPAQEQGQQARGKAQDEAAQQRGAEDGQQQSAGTRRPRPSHCRPGRPPTATVDGRPGAYRALTPDFPFPTEDRTS